MLTLECHTRAVKQAIGEGEGRAGAEGVISGAQQKMAAGTA
jgi:hypothetical protein